MTTTIEILLVEDNPGDVELTRTNMAKWKVPNNLHVAENADQAVRFLRRVGECVAKPRPHLILLDLNLPGRSGRAVLATIKTDPKLKTIPVVVLTSSDAEIDVVNSYKLHANCYIKKPMNMDRLAYIMASIENFWFSIATLPPS